jgi:hypothetical protein
MLTGAEKPTNGKRTSGQCNGAECHRVRFGRDIPSVMVPKREKNRGNRYGRRRAKHPSKAFRLDDIAEQRKGRHDHTPERTTNKQFSHSWALPVLTKGPHAFLNMTMRGLWPARVKHQVLLAGQLVIVHKELF